MTLGYEEKLEELNALVEYVNSCFEKSKVNKNEVSERMLESLRAYKMQYTDDKLKAIKEMGGSEIYMPLVNIKVRALKAWLIDIFFTHSDPPFDLEPTPVPELPEKEMQDLNSKFMQDYKEILEQAVQLREMSGGQLDISPILQMLSNRSQEIKENLDNDVLEYTKKLAEQEKKRIDDQFIEGGFYDALDETMLDIALFPSAIMKGSVPRSKKVFGKNKEIENKVIPTFNRVSPFDIFIAPNATDFSDYVIEILHLKPKDLSDLKKVDGYNEEAIDLVLGLYADIGYSVDYTYEQAKNIEGGTIANNKNYIDIIEFWGDIKGSLLNSAPNQNVEYDDNEYYSVAIWICDNYILKASLNPDPLGNKPYSKTSFVNVAGSFWGLSLYDVLADLQGGINALARSIVNNAALSSGPMIERNIDRTARDSKKAIVPWAMFDSTDMGMTSAPAYRFYQPTNTSNALVQTMAYFLKLADELSGIPAYAHSDTTSGAGARTSSGLQMLMQSSSRGIKQVVKAIDKGIIEPIVKRQYFFNLINYYGLDEDVPDLNIKAKGTTYLMEKDAQTQKFLELLNVTNNPVDLQLLGSDNRKLIWEKVLHNFGVELPVENELKKTISELLAQAQGGGQGGGQAPLPKKADSGSIQGQAAQFRKESLANG
jgi:hypothetical protein